MPLVSWLSWSFSAIPWFLPEPFLFPVLSLPGLASLASFPGLPPLPSLPGLAPLPSLPGLPPLPSLPGLASFVGRLVLSADAVDFGLARCVFLAGAGDGDNSEEGEGDLPITSTMAAQGHSTGDADGLARNSDRHIATEIQQLLT